MKLRIVNRAGIGAATELFDADTGEKLSMAKLRRIEILIDKPGATRAIVEFSNVEIDIVSESEIKPSVDSLVVAVD